MNHNIFTDEVLTRE